MVAWEAQVLWENQGSILSTTERGAVGDPMHLTTAWWMQEPHQTRSLNLLGDDGIPMPGSVETHGVGPDSYEDLIITGSCRVQNIPMAGWMWMSDSYQCS